MRILSLLLLLSWELAFAEDFDIFEYKVPQGWKKNALQGGVMLSLESKTALQLSWPTWRANGKKAILCRVSITTRSPGPMRA